MSLKIRRRDSLFIKLPFFIVVIMVLMGTASLVLLKNTMQKRAMEKISETASLTLSSLDWSIAAVLNAGDRASLQRLVENAGANRFIDRLVVCSSDKLIIASNSPDEVGQVCDNLIIGDVISGKKLISRNIDNKGFYEASIPVTGPDYDLTGRTSIKAAIYMKVRGEVAEQTYESYRNFFIMQYFLISLLILICLFYLINHMILVPLRKYTSIVGLIAERSYGQQVDLVHKDELGRFAEALNSMSNEIAGKNSELSRTNKNLSEYLKAIDESVIVIRSSLGGKITYANNKFYEMTGYSKKEIIGTSINNLRSRIHADEDILDYWDTLLNRFIWKDIIENVSKDGRKFYVNATVNPITDTAGEVIEFIDIWYDITEIYELKEELELHKENLEDLVEVRTKALFESHTELSKLLEESENLNKELRMTHARMIQQEKLASIGQLAAGVAHELNNPIGFISSNFDVMKKYMEKISAYISIMDEAMSRFDLLCSRDCGSEIIPVFERIAAAKKMTKIDFIMEDTHDIFNESEHGFLRVAAIINSLRDFSRIDVEETFSLYNLNEGIMSTLTVARNEIKYVADVETDLGLIAPIYCNGGEINQVLLNIVINAAQSIALNEKEGGRGKIFITTKTEDGQAVCIIKDSGMGIPLELIDRVFDPFFTTKEPGKGTGLGLSISYDIIVNKHKGLLLAENDNGAKFTIKLPLSADAA